MLQVNSQAKSPGLVDWVKKNSTHTTLATATFDTNANDTNVDLSRVMEVLEQKAKENINWPGKYMSKHALSGLNHFDTNNLMTTGCYIHIHLLNCTYMEGV